MYEVIPKSDHGAFKEYSVIHTDRSLNLMSDPFQRVMRDLNQLLKHTYHADKVIIIPGYVRVDTGGCDNLRLRRRCMGTMQTPAGFSTQRNSTRRDSTRLDSTGSLTLCVSSRSTWWFSVVRAHLGWKLWHVNLLPTNMSW